HVVSRSRPRVICGIARDAVKPNMARKSLEIAHVAEYAWGMMIGMSRAVALALVTIAAAAAAEDEDPVEILMRLRDQVMTHAGRIPNHTCVETIRRERYQSGSSALQRSCDSILSFRRMNNFDSTLKWLSTDRLRLDVAFTGEREIYSWAGASKFEDG